MELNIECDFTKQIRWEKLQYVILYSSPIPYRGTTNRSGEQLKYQEYARQFMWVEWAGL